MQFEEEGERLKDLRLILDRVSFAASLFDEDGISVRFMNESSAGEFRFDNVRSEAEVQRIMSQVRFSGLTPLGTALKDKVVEEVLRQARQGSLRKPVLVITITDGQPAGEPQNAVFDTIRYANTEMSRMPRYGPGAISFQFAQVGNDTHARDFLGKLDNDPTVGHLVDCTSSKLHDDRAVQLF